MDGGAPESFEAGGWWTTTMLWTIVLFGSFVLNATLLFAFIKRPGLRTISNRFVMNLIASNLLTCVLLTSLQMLDGPPSSSLGSSLCSISEGASSLVTASSILSVLLIAIDQYFAVVDPLRYRTRIDKLKCGVLILSIWLVSGLVALLAGFNPEPQSLWLTCGPGDSRVNTSINFTMNSTILFGNGTEGYNVEGELKVTEINGSSTIEEDLSFAENSTTFSSKTILESSANGPSTGTKFRVTYGLAYAGFYTIFVYLIPFIGVCWMYINIYLAAHKNSERARRTGSGPMLSSPSFCEEYGVSAAVKQDFCNEDFRRIPKISSLSSIDESIETSPSQIPRRRSEMILSSSPIEEEPASSGVVFTVGSQKVDVSPSNKGARVDPARPAKDSSKLVPISSSSLRSQFLDRRSVDPFDDNLVRSKFNDFHIPDQRRRSSHDIETDRSVLDKFQQDHDSSEESGDEEIMFACSKNRRLEDIEVSKCQNSIESCEDLLSPSDEPDKATDTSMITNKVQSSSYKVVGASGSSVLSRAALENHNQNRDDIFQKISSGQNFADSCLGAAPMVTITPPNKAQPLHRVSSVKSTSSYINSLKYRISNGSLFRYREETRAARISALVIVMGLICWTPYVVMMLLRNMPDAIIEDNEIPHSYDVTAIGFLVVAAYVTPLLFGYRSRRVKRELRKIFCFKKELSYKNNRSLMAKKVLKRKHSSNLGQIEMESKYNIFSCVYGRTRWPKDKVQFMQVPETALAVETCRSSFSSGASTQISTTSTEE